MALTYIKIFVDCLDAIEPLDDGERGRLFTALLQYARTGEAPALQGNERFLFPMLRAQLDREEAAYTAVCEANRANGAKGGRPRKKAPASLESEISQEEEKEEEKDKYKEKKEKEYSSYRASGPQRNDFSRRSRSAPIKQDSPEMIRQDMERMDRFLQQLRQEAAERAAREQGADAPQDEYDGGFY